LLVSPSVKKVSSNAVFKENLDGVPL
jgi:hypothetical protein